MDDIEWNVVNEGHLLDAMVGHKPVGVNKYFQMAFICDKFTDNLHKDVHPDKIWAHLETMYNLEALDESESIPFPNSEREFMLPESEFGSLILKKEEERNRFQAMKCGRETPKLVKDLKKEEKTPVRNQKEHRDSKEGRESKTPQSTKKELKAEKPKGLGKGRGSKEERTPKNKAEDTPKLNKRPTRGSFKSNDDSGSSGKSSPVTVTPTNVKRRRI